MGTRFLSVGLLLFMAICLPFTSAHAAHPVRWDHDISLEVVSDHGKAFPLYAHSASRATYRAYLKARKGKNYGLRIRNNGPNRVGLVIAVDGRNIISGKKSQLHSHERMYVLDPYSEATYDGWRTARNRVNRFYFSDEGASYAGAWGDSSAMGVIAVAVFPEYVEPVYEAEQPQTLSSRSRSSEKGEGRAGTGYGSKKHSPSTRVEFEAEDTASARYFIKYEWRKSLCKKGVIDCPKPKPAPPRANREYAPIEWDNQISVAIVPDRGRAFTLYEHSTKPRLYRAYLKAKLKKRYGIYVKNNSARRVGVVIAVDGRNIISGKKSALHHKERMYVLDPYASATYDGWRSGRNKVNRFFFSRDGGSYAGAWGDHSAMGVIALAVFPEKEQRIRAPAAPALHDGLSRSKRSAAKAGTGYGEEEHSPSVVVRFSPQHHAIERYFVKYEWRKSLCRKGVLRCRDKKPPPPPKNRFWPDDDGFAAPPPSHYR